MKILLLYPQYPDTFWSFKHALKFVSKKAAFPPLGLLTVAAMLPEEWDKRLLDMNVEKLTDEDITWADYVFISAMNVQSKSVKEVIRRCKALDARIVAGGPLFTAEYKDYDEVDHLVLGEAEVTLPQFLSDMNAGTLQHRYKADVFPEISEAAVPQWSLINMKHYASMNLQYSRGCPFDCEFCDIVILNGHKPRTKSKEQLLREMNALYDSGWRGSLFIVDDNFIGNKKKLKTEILPALIEWKTEKKFPFALCTEASINLSDDEELMKLMVDAGFDVVFIGIETPNNDSLLECTKYQNQNRDLVESVKKIQQFGLEVQGGFIVGFDSDPESIFQSQIDFIQNSGIVTAMVGLLNAPTGTKLYQRLMKEDRLLGSFTGNNTSYSLNFVPKMDNHKLLTGYREILDTIYSPKEYYQRVKTFFREFQPPRTSPGKIQSHQIKAFFRSMWYLGIRDDGRKHYWKLFVSYLVTSPPKFARFILFSVYGYHFRKVMVEQSW
ncbi:MAG: DUF4070 domain-containing protein [Dehalococcoidales bacterium]|nr:DUF4070 domain-containing protein [Dehalococcoidales bacterium]